ncbi:endonuclease/exonuclease/phosphatase family protein [Dyadobacter chenwenxiniae]|uniref:Endonuclease/exonuclease/phosphatase family protein n=1 Tax=Dyadobacter chenwenxiniae TaxID=2906456 RepID=A0A9X1PHA7_9BACT|nr:endonuclease/exonuclease/phosphatase family protein [Dyadobacter chenwenxiniae]MCF0060004.1 endonuclease/exonuclease/phosphatase family protein [Dyadobacter chenwenxiniae]UON85744.1 endonuclease/exonuclease/phosphatase family protein [Dyadobacter chenwenxiniae]
MKKIALALSFLFALSQSTFAQKNTINVASYNVRYNTANDGVNAWPNRKENVKGLIRFHEFDIFGVQEALIGQLKDVAELTEFTFYGKGRDDGKEGGEHSAIFYKKDRFKALQSGDFWMSETPDKPGKGWDATCCNRIASWVKFQDLLSKKEFYFFNVHFDHQGVEARRQSGHLMVKKISEIAGKSTVILTGDFNSTPDTEQIKTIQGLLNDSHEVTKQPPYGPEGTFNSFKFDAPMDKRIDYIFVSKNIDVLKYGVLTDAREQRYPSDHQPVLIKVEIK